MNWKGCKRGAMTGEVVKGVERQSRSGWASIGTDAIGLKCRGTAGKDNSTWEV